MEAGSGSSACSARTLAACVIGGIVLGASVLALHHAGSSAIPSLPPLDAVRRRLRRRRHRPVRVYMDGCFDMMHYGHCQMIMVRAVKWVDDIIPDAPYAITEEFMNKLFTEYNIDYIIHGDDPCLLPDGRMLLCVRERSSDAHNHSSLQRQFSSGHGQKVDDGGSGSGTRVSHFLPTSRRIVQFSNSRGPGPDSRIVYIDGAFDLFHAGHVEILRLARELGDFLLVGIHTDQTISSTRGRHRPIMNLHERSLSVLACRYVDEVIIGAPWDVSKDMITTFNISLVVHGTIAENMDYAKDDSNPYAIPMAMGIYHRLESPLDITTSTIIRRIVANHEAYQKRNEKKEASEKKYYEGKSFVNGE
nr:unnamed protein product [Digitaria exilis]